MLTRRQAAIYSLGCLATYLGNVLWFGLPSYIPGNELAAVVWLSL